MHSPFWKTIEALLFALTNIGMLKNTPWWGVSLHVLIWIPLKLVGKGPFSWDLLLTRTVYKGMPFRNWSGSAGLGCTAPELRTHTRTQARMHASTQARKVAVSTQTGTRARGQYLEAVVLRLDERSENTEVYPRLWVQEMAPDPGLRRGHKKNGPYCGHKQRPVADVCFRV